MYVLMQLHITYLYYYGIYIVSRYKLLNFIITYCIASKYEEVRRRQALYNIQ